MERLTDYDHCLKGYKWNDFSPDNVINNDMSVDLVNALDKLGRYEDNTQNLNYLYSEESDFSGLDDD